MTVFHLIVGLDAGGAEKMLFRLVSALPHHKHVVVSLTGIGLVGKQLIDSGHNVHAVDLKLFNTCFALISLWRLIKQYRPDVLQTWMYHSDLLGGMVGRLAGIRNVVWNVRNTEIPQKKFSVTGFIVKLCALFSYVLPRTIVCCSTASLISHVKLGYRRDRMRFIPNGYDVQNSALPSKSKEELKKFYLLPSNAFVIGTVGRYDRLKGYEVFIEAAAKLTELFSQKLLFVMVGRGVDENNIELNKLIKDKGGNAQFKLMGERKDIESIMYMFDVFCLASHAEGFPNVVAEAMLMQVPCVVTDVGDARVIVGTTGVVVKPGQSTALSDALLSLTMLSDNQRTDIGRDARRRIMKKFDINVVALQYAKIYEGKSS
jgi:glycosyltransferase involved in cell wall biosynthesis